MLHLPFMNKFLFSPPGHTGFTTAILATHWPYWLHTGHTGFTTAILASHWPYWLHTGHTGPKQTTGGSHAPDRQPVLVYIQHIIHNMEKCRWRGTSCKVFSMVYEWCLGYIHILKTILNDTLATSACHTFLHITFLIITF